MLKYVETLVSFSEIPDEITSCINISNCHCNCRGCHSPYLAEDIGENLTSKALDTLIQSNKGITCVSFMGGDSSPKDINELAKYIKEEFPELKVAWYSGRQEISKDIDLQNFDIIKIGPYIEELGPLNSKTTNQRMYKIVHNNYEFGDQGIELEDITYKFQK